MTHVSKKKINKTQQKKLTKQLTDLFAAVSSQTSENLFSELFTESEQIMFVKRLAIIVMIDKGYTKYRIAKTLLVSESTVLDMWRKYNTGTYDNLISLINSKKFNSTQFWETVDVLLRLGMPSMGKDRWKGLRM